MGTVKDAIELTKANFKEKTGNGVALVDFWAEWCMPCRMQGPIIDEVAKKIGDKANICKLNVDQERDIAAEFGISSIPSLLIFKDGEVVKQFVGVQSEQTLISAINSI